MATASTPPLRLLLLTIALAAVAHAYDIVLDPGGCTPQEELSSSATLVECEALALAGSYSHFIRFRSVANEERGLCSACPDGFSEAPALTFYTLYRVTMPPSPPPGPPAAPPSPPPSPSPPPPKPPPMGCTDSNALNYAPGVGIDDGSCVLGGCTDPAAPEYDPTASFDDGSCTILIRGCTDSTTYLNNYRPAATVDDGSCGYLGCIEDAHTVTRGGR